MFCSFSDSNFCSCNNAYHDNFKEPDGISNARPNSLRPRELYLVGLNNIDGFVFSCDYQCFLSREDLAKISKIGLNLLKQNRLFEHARKTEGSIRQFDIGGAHHACTSMALLAAMALFEGEGVSQEKIDDLLDIGAACHASITAGNVNEMLDACDCMAKYNETVDNNSKFYMNVVKALYLIKNQNSFYEQLKEMLQSDVFDANGKTAGILTGFSKSYALAVTKENNEIKQIEFFDSHGRFDGEIVATKAYYLSFEKGSGHEIIKAFCNYLKSGLSINYANQREGVPCFVFHPLQEKESTVEECSVYDNNPVRLSLVENSEEFSSIGGAEKEFIFHNKKELTVDDRFVYDNNSMQLSIKKDGVAQKKTTNDLSLFSSLVAAIKEFFQSLFSVFFVSVSNTN